MEKVWRDAIDGYGVYVVGSRRIMLLILYVNRHSESNVAVRGEEVASLVRRRGHQETEKVMTKFQEADWSRQLWDFSG